MAQTNLQVPIDTKTRNAAKKIANRQGFSSIQEMIRVFLTQIVHEQLRISFAEQPVLLSEKAQMRYKKLLAQKTHGKGSSSVDVLLTELET